jgi:phosphonate metabolism protein PhnN/1,5-bisphosphokinase (PRPP-forming)
MQTNGQLFVVVGPSGSGKDTLLKKVINKIPNSILVKRYITRKKDIKNEDHYSISIKNFEDKISKKFSYGIPYKEIKKIKQGKKVIFNGSRKILFKIKKKVNNVKIINITASSTIIKRRLVNRAREDKKSIIKRIKRKINLLPKNTITIINNKSISIGTNKLKKIILAE